MTLSFTRSENPAADGLPEGQHVGESGRGSARDWPDWADWAQRTGTALLRVSDGRLDDVGLTHVADSFAARVGISASVLTDDPERLFAGLAVRDRERLRDLLLDAQRRGQTLEWRGEFATPVGRRWLAWVSVPSVEDPRVAWGWLREVSEGGPQVGEPEAVLRRRLDPEAAADFGFGFWELDLRTSDEHWSEGHRQLFGIEDSVTEPSLRAVAAGLGRPIARRLEAALAGARETGDAFEMEWRLSLAEGEPRYVSMRGRGVRGADGAVDWIKVSSFDVTKQRLAERAARESEERFLQAQKMEAVGRLAGGVAHDFNNLLTAIRGFTELAMERLPEASPIRADLDEVILSTRRAQELTGKLVTIGRQQVSKREPVDVNRTISEMEPLLRRSLAEDISFHLELEPVSKTVRAHPSGVEQIVLNLAINASDAMPAGGRLEISTSARPAADLPMDVSNGAEHYLLLRVSDSGCGIGEREMSHIFEPFFTTKPTGKGTGLGLATVYNIVDDMGGAIHVDSVVGEGTTMSIVLPLSGDREPREAISTPQNLPRGSETILVVEDDHRVRRFTTRSLTSLGYRVLQAEHGAAALEVLASEEPIDLLFTDVVMPGMSGTELARRAIETRPDLRVLFTTGFTQDRLILHGLDLGRDDILLKPFTLGQLAGTVRTYLEAPAGDTTVRLLDETD